MLRTLSIVLFICLILVSCSSDNSFSAYNEDSCIEFSNELKNAIRKYKSKEHETIKEYLDAFLGLEEKRTNCVRYFDISKNQKYADLVDVSYLHIKLVADIALLRNAKPNSMADYELLVEETIQAIMNSGWYSADTKPNTIN